MGKKRWLMDIWETGRSGFFKVELAVAGTVVCDLVFMVHARALDCPVLFFIPAPEPAWAVLVPEFCLVPDKPTDYCGKLFFIGVEHQFVFLCIGMRPFQHIRFSSMFF
jgi:hypothetical protein